jgi:hypothetical protein
MTVGSSRHHGGATGGRRGGRAERWRFERVGEENRRNQLCILQRSQFQRLLSSGILRTILTGATIRASARRGRPACSFFLDRPRKLCLEVPPTRQPAARSAGVVWTAKPPHAGFSSDSRRFCPTGWGSVIFSRTVWHTRCISIPPSSPDGRRRTNNRPPGDDFASKTLTPPTVRERPRAGPAPAPVQRVTFPRPAAPRACRPVSFMQW